jgi:hypothetical protein
LEVVVDVAPKTVWISSSLSVRVSFSIGPPSAGATG